MFGIASLAMAVLTFLSFMSPNQGQITGKWLSLLRQGFGWGAFVMPVGFGAMGLGLLMQGFGRLPAVRWEKVAGLLLIFTTILGLSHLSTAADDPWSVVVEGRGGGLLGWALAKALEDAFGSSGAWVVVAALFLIGWMLFLGLSTAEMGMAVWLGWDWLRGQFLLWRAGRFTGLPRAEPEHPITGRTKARFQPLPMPGGSRRTVPAGSVPVRVIGEEPRSAPKVRVLTLSRPETGRTKGAWHLPPIQEILEDWSQQELSQAEIQGQVQIIEQTLESLGVPARVVEVNQGPAITQFGVEPGFTVGRGGKQTKVKVSKISSLADDLALALAARSIRIEAPVPGKGYVGIEVPNQEVTLVALRDVMESETFQNISSHLRLGLGKDVSGRAIAADLAAMPHLLIAGTTGSGKSVCVNAIVSSLLLQNTPDDLQFVMVDPKRVELTNYNGIPQLLAPVVVELDRVVSALQWVSREMDDRYHRFAKEGVRNITDYNQRMQHINQKKMHTIVVVIDELADLMIMAPDETERVITRLAQLARATGIHLVIATQRPSVDVVTGLIKANFSARIAFAVASSVDSRVILDQPGAERLLGRGDMLFQAPDASAPVRMQGAFVSEAELGRLIRYWKNAAIGGEVTQPVPPTPVQTITPGVPLKQAPLWEESAQPEDETDPIYDQAVATVRNMHRASISLLQRRLRIGYTRAARLIDQLEERGIVGPAQSGSQPREVLDYGEPTLSSED